MSSLSGEAKSKNEKSAASSTTQVTTTTTVTRGGSTSRSGSQQQQQDYAQAQAEHQKRSQSVHNGSQRGLISPNRVTRIQEKEELQNLNDRLVIYIDTVRKLESENNMLRVQVTTYSEQSSKEVTEIKALYEHELDEAKSLIDEIAKQKAKFEIENLKLKASAEEALGKLAQRDKEAKSWEQRTKAAESQALEFKSRYESLQASTRDNEEELAALKPQLRDLEKQLDKVKKQLEDETLLRVDLENKNQTMKEELSFKTNVYDKEINQLRTSKRVEVEQADLRLRDEYDSRLISELQRMREEADEKIQEMKQEIDKRYQTKTGDTESAAKRYQNSIQTYQEEISSLRIRVTELESDQKNEIKKIASLELKCRDYEEKIRNLNQRYSKDIADKDRDIEIKNTELHEMMNEYRELYDIKIALDMEIAAYRKLLESEEQRLNISSFSTSQMHATGSGAPQLGASYLENSKTTSPRGGVAKKRRLQDASGGGGGEASAASGGTSHFLTNELQSSYLQTQENTSGIEIDTHDQMGKQVRLLNTQTKDVNLHGWKLSRKANDITSEFKFGKSVILKQGQNLTVWSSDAGVKSVLPTDFVMPQGQKWCVADAMVTVLVDKDEQEKSRRESRKKESSEKKLKLTDQVPRSGLFGFFTNNKK
jgi:chromosome segregation ATPase